MASVITKETFFEKFTLTKTVDVYDSSDVVYAVTFPRKADLEQVHELVIHLHNGIPFEPSMFSVLGYNDTACVINHGEDPRADMWWIDFLDRPHKWSRFLYKSKDTYVVNRMTLNVRELTLYKRLFVSCYWSSIVPHVQLTASIVFIDGFYAGNDGIICAMAHYAPKLYLSVCRRQQHDISRVVLKHVTEIHTLDYSLEKTNMLYEANRSWFHFVNRFPNVKKFYTKDGTLDVAKPITPTKYASLTFVYKAYHKLAFRDMRYVFVRLYFFFKRKCNMPRDVILLILSKFDIFDFNSHWLKTDAATRSEYVLDNGEGCDLEKFKYVLGKMHSLERAKDRLREGEDGEWYMEDYERDHLESKIAFLEGYLARFT
jgi:hypothetical protein